MGFNFERLRKKDISPSKVAQNARQYVPGSRDELFYYWRLCSKYAHAQTLTVLHRGLRTHEKTALGGTVRVESDPALLADVVEYAVKVTDALVSLVRTRGLSRLPTIHSRE
jgi:hypothetical protein